jgi:hypothetical protein
LLRSASFVTLGLVLPLFNFQFLLLGQPEERVFFTNKLPIHIPYVLPKHCFVFLFLFKNFIIMIIIIIIQLLSQAFSSWLFS